MKKSLKELATELGELTEEKQAAYGDSFGKTGDILRILFPRGVRPEQYTDLLCIARMLDKLFRIATRKDAFGESPFKDLVGYSLLGAQNDEREDSKRAATEPPPPANDSEPPRVQWPYRAGEL